MKRKVFVAMLCLAMSVSTVACGQEAATEQDTENILSVQETEEGTEVVPGDTTDTGIENDETEETNAIEDTAETETPQSLELTYEDFEFSYNDYTNYIDFDNENPVNYGIQIIYPDANDDEYVLRAENDTTKRGLKLGDSRERVLELYGDYDKCVTYRNMRLKYGECVPEENYIYYLQEPKPTTFDGLYMICITLDTNGNVLAIQYGGAESKYM